MFTRIPIIAMLITPVINHRIGRISRLRAEFQVDQNGKTYIQDRYYTAPLRISRAFRPDGGTGELYVYTTDVSPGVLDGDHYQSEWIVGSGAHLILSSTSAVRLHPTPHNPSTIEQSFRLEEGAILEYFPEVVIPFRGSSCSMKVHFQLAPDAILVYGEVWAAGRIHYGEAFDFHSYCSMTEINRERRMMVWDKINLYPNRDQYDGIASFMNYTHSAVMWIIAPGMGEDELCSVREMISELSKNTNNKMLAGASLLAHHSGDNTGIGVRMLGRSAEQLQQCCILAWNAIRPKVINKPALQLRK